MLAYFHIPFCESKCPYCAFNSYAHKDALKEHYMQALLTQFLHDIKRFNIKQHSLESVFIGGGTPSVIEVREYEPLFDVLTPYLKPHAEITSEANPSSSTKEWLLGMKKLGVNRISFGVQSFNEKKLQFLGRRHSKKMAIEAIESAFDIGIAHLSLDLIYGCLPDSSRLLKEDLAIASSLPIDHLSAYALTLEKETPFYSQKHFANESHKLAKTFVSQIIEAGFPQYEISNFGTYQSIHNRGYWQQKEYLGIGSGAVGFVNNQRFYPSKKIEIYLKNPLEYECENLLQKELHLEKIFLGLRSNVGIGLNELLEPELKKVRILLDEQKLFIHENRLFNSDYFLSDEIALFITS